MTAAPSRNDDLAELDNLAAKQYVAAAWSHLAEQELTECIEATADAMHAEDRDPTDAELDAYMAARERVAIAEWQELGPLRRRRAITGRAHPDDLDAVAVQMRAVRGYRLPSGRELPVGGTVIVTADVAIEAARIGALELAEDKLPKWWPRSIPVNLGSLAGRR